MGILPNSWPVQNKANFRGTAAWLGFAPADRVRAASVLNAVMGRVEFLRVGRFLC
jgi:hypothetical protein